MIALSSPRSGLLNRRGYLYRLGTAETESDTHCVELRVACARSLVAASCLLLMWISPTEAELRKGPALLLLYCYGATSLLLIFRMLWKPHVGRSFGFALHAADVLLVTSFFTLTQGPNAPSLVLFFFLLMAAAVRWAHRGTLATAFAAIVLVFLVTVTKNRTAANVLNSHFLTQAGYLLIIGSVLGMLSEKLKRLRAESALWQLNAKAGEDELARVACELHDGPIQSLIGIEMRLEALRRKMAPKNRDLDQQLGLLQDKLRQEIADLREFMQRLKPVRVDSEHLVEFLADVAERFRQTSGIATRFISHVENVDLSEGVRCELVRILQEALINIRKHSGADTVDVSLQEREGNFLLVISDNGRGLDFKGRLSYAELKAHAKGPAVIKERLRLIGGELAIESLPDRGTRLEIMIPSAGNPIALRPLAGAEAGPGRRTGTVPHVREAHPGA